MFKAIPPTVSDTVQVLDVDGNEITRFVAVWKRPDSDARKALLNARMENLSQLRMAQNAMTDAADDDLKGFNAALAEIEAGGKARIREHLERVDGLLDERDVVVDYSPPVLDELLKWAEYTNPLTESLARLAEGRCVLEAQAKNSVPPVLGGLAPVDNL